MQKLSLGNQQRVQLAAALVHDPAALVLDEPFSGLDPLAVDVMSEVLRDTAAHGVPVIFSSHQLDLVERLCDRVGHRAAGAGWWPSAPSTSCGPAAPARLVVHAPQAPPGWAARAARRACRTRVEEGRDVLELAPDADDQPVLRAALATGPVHEFRRRQASLTELFRHAVSEQVAA